jgi:hypothetical protein
METAFEYWIENQDRWATMLIIANDISAMYSLPTLPEDQIRRLGGYRALPMMWWRDNSTGRAAIGHRFTCSKTRYKLEDLNCVSSEDRICCMQGIVGVLRYRMWLSVSELDCVLGISRGTVDTMLKGWDAQSRDFKVMFYGLSGDMRNKGLRNLVLGMTS